MTETATPNVDEFYPDDAENKKRARHLLLCVLQSLPALAAVITAASLVWAARHTRQTKIASEYSTLGRKALADEDWPLAEVCFRKLIHLDESDKGARYNLAMVVERREGGQRARHLMAQIAPLDQPGYAPAHLWLAKQLLASSPTPPSPEAQRQRLEEMENRLLLALDQQPNHSEANALLGRLYLQTNQLQQAAPHLAKAVGDLPELRLALAQCYALLGKTSMARREGKLAVTHYAQLLKADRNNVPARLQLAAHQMVLEQFATAEDTLRQGLALSKDKRFQTALAALYVRWFDRTKPTQLRRRLELLQRALSYAPESPTVLKRLTVFGEHDGAEAAQAIAILKKALARGDAPSTVHTVLGTLYTATGEHKKGIFHLELAFRGHPHMPQVTNNLAWALVHAQPPKFERALSLINAALQASPNHPSMRDTRGVIHLRMKNYQQAIVDFEAALNRMPDHTRLRTDLATAYDKLGHADLAAEQRRIVARLKTLAGLQD